MSLFQHGNCSRRRFLGDMGMGVTGMVLGSMLAEERLAGNSPPPDAVPTQSR